MKYLVSLIALIMLSSLLSACDANANNATEEITPEATEIEATAEATETGEEATIQGTVVEVIFGVAADGNNEIVLNTADGEVRVLVMEAGPMLVEERNNVCDKNEVANEVFNTLQAGDEIEVFGLLREDGVLAVCSDARFSITVLSQAEATAEATETGEEATIQGTVVEVIFGIAFDGNNEIVLNTADGEVRVLVMEAGFVPEDMRDQVCNKNEAANEVFNTLQAGDEIEVFGLLREDGIVAVCSDARFSITVLNEAEGTEEANMEAAGEEATLQGTVVEVIFGIAFDGNNEIVLNTADGQVNVLVMEAGFVPEDMRDQVCNKNEAANEVFNTLQAGDEIEVFGLLREDGILAVCSDARFSITVLSQAEGTEEASVEERTIVGTVLENNHSCEVDAVCYLLVDTPEGEWRVVYGTGERLPVAGQAMCNVSSEYTQAAWDVEVGAEIEAFGRVRDENEIGLCYEGPYTLFVNN